MIPATAAMSEAELVLVCFCIALDAARRAQCRVSPLGWVPAVATLSVLASAAASAGTVSSLRALPALAVAGVSAITDVQTGYVFDRVLLFGGALLSVVALALGTPGTAAMGAIVSGGSLWAMHVLTKGRGIGLGDAKLAALLGAAAGIHGALDLMAIAFVAGGTLAGMLLLLGRRRRTDSMAFAPFLTAAACLVAVWGTT